MNSFIRMLRTFRTEWKTFEIAAVIIRMIAAVLFFGFYGESLNISLAEDGSKWMEGPEIVIGS